MHNTYRYPVPETGQAPSAPASATGLNTHSSGGVEGGISGPSSGRPDSDRIGSVPGPGEASARHFDDEWRRWIAENLHIGNTPESVVETLVANGYPRPEA